MAEAPEKNLALDIVRITEAAALADALLAEDPATLMAAVADVD